MPGALILINGFPGVGKHTVAYELVNLIPNCKFFDTRTLVAAASQLFDSADPSHGLLRKNLKHAIFSALAQQPPQSPPPVYVLTDFLSVAARPTDRAIMHEFVAFAQESGYAFLHLILSCGSDANLARLASPERVKERRAIEALASKAGAGVKSEGEGDTGTKAGTKAGDKTSCAGLSAEIGTDSNPDNDTNCTAFGTTSGPLGTTSCPLGTAFSGTSAGVIATDTSYLVQLRMEEEIGHIAPTPGLSGEYELDTTHLDAPTAAGILAEYALDMLRRHGWWIPHSASARRVGGVGRGGVGDGVGVGLGGGGVGGGGVGGGVGVEDAKGAGVDGAVKGNEGDGVAAAAVAGGADGDAPADGGVTPGSAGAASVASASAGASAGSSADSVGKAASGGGKISAASKKMRPRWLK